MGRHRVVFPNKSSCGLNQGFPAGSVVKRIHLSMQETQETQVRSWGWEDTLEKGMATHPSIRVWKIPWTEEPGRLQPMG